MNARVFHYTVGEYLPAICQSGEIRPATARVPRGERPAVWCTTSDSWEPTASKGAVDANGNYRGLTRKETEQHGDGLVRIEVDPEAVPLRWREFVIHSGVGRRIAKALHRSARRQGSNVNDWRLSFDPIPLSRWLNVERWNGSKWESLIDDREGFAA